MSNEKRQWVVITGNMVDGIGGIYGPFDEAEDADEYASIEHEEWHVVEIRKPI